MQLKSVPIAALGLLATINASSLSSEQARKEALSLLQQNRSPRRNHGTFEELGSDDYERECVEEICDLEELTEIYPEDKELTKTKWASLVDQCHVTPCSAVGTAKCVQRWRARTCVCLGHVNGNDTVEGVARFEGPDCLDDVDECADKAKNTKCGEKTCINSIGSFKCGCEQGYDDVDGECVDVDECANGTDMCGDNTSCVNMDGSHSCKCDDGYDTDSEDANRCVNIDECEEQDICSSIGLSKSCVDSEGSYACICDEPGYYDNNGECADINECHAQPCSGPTSSCENVPGSHQCFCGEGYELDDTESICVDIDECQTLGQCMMGQCWNTLGSFECCTTTTHDFNELTGECTLKNPCEDFNCDSGYECKVTNTLLNEAECVDIDECDQVNTCNEVEECRNTDGSYVCESLTTPQAAMAATTEATTTPVTTEATTEATTAAPTTTTTITTTTKKKSKCRRRNKRDTGLEFGEQLEFEFNNADEDCSE